MELLNFLLKPLDEVGEVFGTVGVQNASFVVLLKNYNKKKPFIQFVFIIIITIIIIFIYPLTARAPQMISQPISSIFFLFSTALWDSANSRPVHSLMMSSHLFLCLPCLLPLFTVPCKMVLARPDERET